MTILVRRWFHIYKAEQRGIEPDDYDNWFSIVSEWPLKRAVPSWFRELLR